MKKFLKEIIKKILYKKGYYIGRFVHFKFFIFLLETFLKKEDKIFFIQIGANDSISFDPIYDFVTNNSDKVKGILLEPLPDCFEDLKRNYKGFSNVILLNQAIHNSKAEMTMYRPVPEKIKHGELPESNRGIASFDKKHLELSAIPEDSIIEQKVRCTSLNSLLKEHNVTKLDLLQIDTEGYDSEIILNLDFKTIKPKIIHFEHGISDKIMSMEQFRTLIDLLHRNGYELWIDKYDATAYQRDLFIPKGIDIWQNYFEELN